jgi:hypothetical protein
LQQSLQAIGQTAIREHAAPVSSCIHDEAAVLCRVLVPLGRGSLGAGATAAGVGTGREHTWRERPTRAMNPITPVVFRYKGFRFFFYSNEGSP